MMTPKTAPLRSKLRLFPRATAPAETTNPVVSFPAGALRGGFRINGHPATVYWWRRRPPDEVDDAVRLDSDVWIALRAD